MILHAMLQRLYASLVHGPSMNARPHRSRQRCDLMDLGMLAGTAPSAALPELLEKGKLEFPARVKAPAGLVADAAGAEGDDGEGDAGSNGGTKISGKQGAASRGLTPEQKAAKDAWLAQSRLLKKLRDIAEDATSYLNDHGESCLALGFPLLSMPPGADDTGIRQGGRILAPLLLMPLDLQVRSASRPGVTLSCTGAGADMLVPNPALLAWLERQTGKQIGELFTDEEGADPWREIAELLTQIAGFLGMEKPPVFTAETILTPVPLTDKLPAEVSVLPCAVLGLFPLSNQSLLRDTRWMEENEKALVEPAASFLSPQALQNDGAEPPPETPARKPRKFAAEWFVSPADPCQANAVLAAREARALVVHGPPGTGKSQTITNMIADHLARRQRVLFVCDKRTALDVVKYRLDATGLGDFCGVVHDPGADRKEFYMGLRSQLEVLAETPVPPDPRQELDTVNAQLASLHAELDGCRRKLHDIPDGAAQSFHELLGTFLGLSLRTQAAPLAEGRTLTVESLHASRTLLEEIARRAASAGYAGNPLRGLHTTDVQAVLTKTPEAIRAAFSAVLEKARSADAARPRDAVLAPDVPLETQSAQRRKTAEGLRRLAACPDRDFIQKALAVSPQSRKALSAELEQVRPDVENLARSAPDAALLASARSAGALTLPAANQHLAALVEWQAVAGNFFKRLFSGAKKQAARAALTPLGLAFPDGVESARTFYQSARIRLLLADLAGRIAPSAGLPSDAELTDRLETARLTWAAADAYPAITADAAAQTAAAAVLETEAVWADALAAALREITATGLFRPEANAILAGAWCRGDSAGDDAAS